MVGRLACLSSAFVVAVAALAGGRPAQAALISMPYDNDFSTSVADFVETTDSRWSLGDGVYVNSHSGQDVGASAGLQVSNLGGAAQTDFVMSSRFNVTSYTNLTTSAGFFALGADANATDGTGAFYLADIQFGENDIRLFKVNSNQQYVDTDLGFTFQTGRWYEMVLRGEYNASGHLTLTFSLDDLTLGSTDYKEISQTITMSVLTGQYFGFRDRASSFGGALNVSFDDFHLGPVPEPASLGLVLVGAVMVLGRRRGA